MGDLMTDLEALVQYWQERLRLRDWVITIRICRYHELEESIGDCLVDEHTKTALIKLMDPIDEASVPNLLYAYSLEETMIHELLHIHLNAWEAETDIEKTQQEWAINAIAGALMKTKYDKNN